MAKVSNVTGISHAKVMSDNTFCGTWSGRVESGLFKYPNQQSLVHIPTHVSSLCILGLLKTHHKQSEPLNGVNL